MGDKHVSEVLKFIEKFKDAKDTFLNGCCYWFAWILKFRFDGCGWLVDIFHDPVEGHFVARFIEDITDTPDPEASVYFFDVRGNVTGMYEEEELENMDVMRHTEERRWARLMCMCKDMICPEDWPDWLKD